MGKIPEWIGAIATAAAALVAGFYTVLTYRLLKVTTAGVQIAQKTFSLSHRPYVGVTEVKLQVKDRTKALLCIRIQNFGSVPARDMNTEVTVQIGHKLFTQESSKHLITLFPQVSNQAFAVPLSGDQLLPFTCDGLEGANIPERMDIEIRIVYRGLDETRFETTSSHHKNSQDSHFLDDQALST